MAALCCPNSYMHCHVVQGAVRVVQVHMELWLLTDSGYDLSVSSFYMLDMLHFKVINTDAIKLTCLSPYPFSGHFEARLMKQELHLLPKMSLVCHGFGFFFCLPFFPNITVIITVTELSVELMFFWLNGPWLFSGHQLFPAGHQSQRTALCLHYYCLSR